MTAFGEVSLAPASGSERKPEDDIVVDYHLDIVDRHPKSPFLSCVTGWIVAERGYTIVSLALKKDPQSAVRCNYPFHQGDAPSTIVRSGDEVFTNFSVLLPERLAIDPAQLSFVAMIAPDDGEPQPWRLDLDPEPGLTRQLRLGAEHRLAQAPSFTDVSLPEAGPLVEHRLFDHLARQRWLTLRLDLINKCNLRCVMCHYSDEKIAKRPAQRIAPEKFAAFFDPIAPITREVVLSCGDEPLMSPHFEQIVRELAARDPEIRIRFCTNAMLLNEKLAEAIIASRVYQVMFSFDGVTSETLHRIRVGSDYRRIIANILGLKRRRAESAHPRTLFVFNYVMLASNIHEAPLFVRLAKRLGADTIDFRHVVQGDVYDIEHEMLERCPTKFNYYRARIVAAAAACGVDIGMPPPFASSEPYDATADPVCTLTEFNETLRELGEDPARDPDLPRPFEVSRREHIYEAAHVYCDRPFSEVMIRDQRDVYPCPWHREKMGTLEGETTLDEIFLGDKFRNLRLAMLSTQGAAGCAGCPIKSNHLPTRMI